jgi:hypothetical protein
MAWLLLWHSIGSTGVSQHYGNGRGRTGKRHSTGRAHFGEFGSGGGRRPAHGAGLSAGRLTADFDRSFRERSGGGLAGTPISYVTRD